MNNLISPHWDDLLTNSTGSCIFSSTTGTAPNRIFNLEWRATLFTGGGSVNFELRLYETTGEIDFVYGTVTNSGSSATVGVQRGTGPQVTQFSCNTASLSSGLQLAFTQPTCGTATPTNTPGGPT